MDTESTPPAAPTEPVVPSAPSPQPRWHRRVPWKVLGLVGLAIAGLLAAKSLRGDSHPAATADAEPTVAVVKVDREDLFKEVTIPAEFRPYAEAKLFAKVSGYLDQMNVDFGDIVKSNQLIATLLVPELNDQLHNAIATRQKAEADYTNAHLTYNRLVDVNRQRPGLVAQQDLDTAQAREGMASAAIAAAKADVEKYQTLVNYTRITAPFDGVVTWRYADPGALIQAGTASDSQTLPLVRVSDNYRLRLDFYVSVEDVKDIHLGDPVAVRVDSLNQKTFNGVVSRFTRQVDEATRRMTTEVEVPNPDLDISPGMYATVVLKVQRRPHALAIPIESVAGPVESTAGVMKSSVSVVNPGGQIEECPVTLGLETPGRYEVLSGLSEGDLVVIGNHSDIRPGQRVATKLLAELPVQ